MPNPQRLRTWKSSKQLWLQLVCKLLTLIETKACRIATRLFYCQSYLQLCRQFYYRLCCQLYYQVVLACFVGMSCWHAAHMALILDFSASCNILWRLRRRVLK